MWYLMLFGITLFGVWRVQQYALRKGMLDIPNRRSSHTIPTPRGGGIAFVTVFLGSLLVQTIPDPKVFALKGAAAIAVLIALLSFIEDRFGVRALIRLFSQFIITLAMVCFLTAATQFQWWGFPVLGISFATITTVWFINLYNFMDGMDGLAAGEGISIFIPIGFLFQWSAESLFATVCFSLSACIAGFWVLNWPKARIFMGDVGSTFLGFWVATMALLTLMLTELPVVYWVILSTLFWLDATVTLVRRYWAGERITQAHCSHAYQRLHQSGWSHVQVLRGLLALNALFTLFAVGAFYKMISISMALGLSVSLGITVLWMIEKRQPRIIRK
jgi:Fuc2NAc and GlcNAc transferase